MVPSSGKDTVCPRQEQPHPRLSGPARPGLPGSLPFLVLVKMDRPGRRRPGTCWIPWAAVFPVQDRPVVFPVPARRLRPLASTASSVTRRGPVDGDGPIMSDAAPEVNMNSFTAIDTRNIISSIKLLLRCALAPTCLPPFHAGRFSGPAGPCLLPRYPDACFRPGGFALAPGSSMTAATQLTVIRPVGVKPAMSLSIWRTAALSCRVCARRHRLRVIR